MQFNFNPNENTCQERVLEDEWFKTRYNPAQLLETFPEARSYLEQRLERYERYLESVKKILKPQIEAIYKEKDEFTRWFWLEVLKEIEDGQLLEICENEVWKTKRYLKEERKSKSGVSDSQIERAKENLERALEIVGMERSRNNFYLCPFHNEKTASFYATPQNGRCFCFGCLWSGDSIKLVQELTGYSFVEAVKQLN